MITFDALLNTRVQTMKIKGLVGEGAEALFRAGQPRSFGRQVAVSRPGRQLAGFHNSSRMDSGENETSQK